MSGSAVIANGLPTLVYTGGTWDTEAERAAREKGINPERQMVAVAADPSDPYLRKWIKVPHNPVLSNPPKGIKATGWRDPSLWKERDTWYMVIGSAELGRGGMALLYNSKDLRKFEYLHPLAIAKPDSNAQSAAARFAMWECPDFFLIDGKPILMVAAGNRYLTGSYSEKEHLFHQEDEGVIDCGRVADRPTAISRTSRPLTAQTASWVSLGGPSFRRIRPRHRSVPPRDWHKVWEFKDMPERFEIYSAISRDNGKTFSAPFKVSTAPSPGVSRRRGMHNLGRDFISVGLDDDFVHMTWFDDRSGYRATWYGRIPLRDFK